MKKILFLFMLLILIPIAFAQTYDYDFFNENSTLYSIDSGLLYLNFPNSTLEKEVKTVSLMFMPSENLEYSFTLEEDGDVLTSNFKIGDDSPNNQSYLIFTWNLFVESNRTLDLKLLADGDLVYEKSIFIESISRELENQKVIESSLPLNTIFLDDVFLLRKKLSTVDFDLTEDQFNDYYINAKELDISKELITNTYFYEGDLVYSVTTSKINLPEDFKGTLYVIESVDKSIAKLASEIESNIPPLVIEEDPLIMWTLNNTQEPNLSYEITKNGSFDDHLTGNTILLAKPEEGLEGNKLFLKTILPLILIPIIVFIVVYFGAINIKKKR